METVDGIGGYFLRATDPESLSAWYRDALGIPLDGNGLWFQPAGPTVIATFPSDSDYWRPQTQQSMLDFRVSDLDAMLHQLRLAGAVVDDTVEVMDGVGRFGWVADPEGNRIELWQPE